ncbi:MAG: substrate binding domain-containing protein, partial [Proteobacteria bacterium]|nr:substrate binding domain-containing protein [Pseudomonadota bacterium]
PTGTLRITSPRLFAEAFLVPVLTPYLQAYPEVSVELDLTERNADLVGEGFDLALRIGVPADSSMVIRRLGAAPMLFVASHGYVESHGVPTKAESFGNHQLIVVSSGGDVRWPIRQGGDVRPVPVRGRLKVNSLVVARRAALSGLGVAFLPRFMVRDDLESGELVEVLAGLGPEPMPVCALYPSREQLSPRVRVFLDLLVAHTRDHSPWS